MNAEAQQKEQKLYSWREGMPTGPDVSLLQATYPSLQVGDRIPYEDVTAIIGHAPDSVRFRSVTNAWRAKLRESGKVIYCEIGVAFVVARCDQITERTAIVFRHVSRVAKAQRRDLSMAVAETDVQRQAIEHQGRLLLVVEREAKKARMNVLPSVPQPKPVAQIVPPITAAAEPR